MRLDRFSESDLVRRSERNIRLMLVWRMVMQAICFTIPSIALYWESAGLALADMLYLQAYFAAGILVFDAGLGYIADVWGRKRTLVVGTAMFAVGIAVYGTASSFATMLVAELVLALAIAFLSGTEDSFIASWLRVAGNDDAFGAVQNRQLFAARITGVVLGFVSAPLLVFGLRAPYVAAICFYAAALVLALMLEEPPRGPGEGLTESGRLSMLRVSAREIWKVTRFCVVEHSVVRWIVVMTAVLSALQHVAFWMVQPFLIQDGWSKSSVAYISAGLSAFGALLGWSVGKLERKLGLLGGAIALWVALWACGLAASLLPAGAAVVAFGGLYFVWSFGEVYRSAQLNPHLPEELRTTALSVTGSLSRVLYIAALLVTAPVIDGTRVRDILLVLSPVGFVLGGAVLLCRPRRRAAPEAVRKLAA